MKKTLLIGALAFAASAIAQTAMAAEFYVVRDTTTKKCTVVDAKPTTTTTTVVDNGTFKTKTEAETGMKTMKVCTENYQHDDRRSSMGHQGPSLCRPSTSLRYPAKLALGRVFIFARTILEIPITLVFRELDG